MKIIPNNQAIEVTLGASISVTEFPLNASTMNVAISKITGRYPSERRITNEQCMEIAHVLEGDGKVVLEGKEHKLNKGDTVQIEPGEKFYWEGNMKLYLSCSPAWYIEQHKEVD